MDLTKKQSGSLEVICGPMFSGKSEELIRRLRRAKIAKQQVIAFKPAIDNRYSLDHVASHNGSTIEALPMEHGSAMRTIALNEEVSVIGIDEVQFFPADIVNLIYDLILHGKRVIVAGLDLDFRGIPFGCMPILLALANKVSKLQAICTQCGDDAYFTQRLVNGNPAKYNDPLILIGAQEGYQARCRHCYSIDQIPIF